MKKTFKQLVFIALAFVVFAGSLALENVFASSFSEELSSSIKVVVASGQTVNVIHNGTLQTVSGQGDEVLQTGDTLEVTSGSGVEIHFSDKGVLRLDQGALVSLDFLDQQKNAYVLNLKKGRVWGNTLYTSAVLNLIANGAYIIPHFGIFDADIADQKTTVYAHRHQIIVGIVPLDYKATSAKLFPDGDLINSYMLAEGIQTTVFADKINQNADTLRKLFYSKLVKEFPFGTFDTQLLSSDSWLQQNVALDTAYGSKVVDDDSRNIRSRGLKIADLNNTFGQALNSFYNVLTFSEAKVVDRNLNDIFDRFDDAKYLLLFGQTTKAQDYLNSFKSSLDTAFNSGDDLFKGQAVQHLYDEYDELNYAGGDNTLAPAQTMLSDELFSKLGDSENEIQEKFLLVRNVLNQVYDLAVNNAQASRDKLLVYFDQLQKLFNAEKSRLNGMSNILAEENQLVDNLLLTNAVFYRDSLFEKKSQLENDYLALIPEGDEKNEEKQTIIGNKIGLLHQLQTFFLADEVTVDDAKAISQRISHDYDALQLPTDQQVAVDSLYAKQVSDFYAFYLYLTSPDYVATTLHGASRQDQFNAFLQDRQQSTTENLSFEQLSAQILGNQNTPTRTPDKILAQAQQDFASIGATNVVFGPYTDVTQKLIPLQSATVSGTTIQAQYDWDNQLVSQIYSNGTLFSADAIKLNNLALLIQSKTEAPPVQPVPRPTPLPSPSPSTSASKAELVAKILLIQKLKSNDVALTQSDITIVDLSNSLFTIGKATLISDQSLTMSFDIDAKNNIVTNLSVLKGSKQNAVNGQIDLSDLSTQVEANL